MKAIQQNGVGLPFNDQVQGDPIVPVHGRGFNHEFFYPSSQSPERSGEIDKTRRLKKRNKLKIHARND
jgi:hypothetical protein